MISSMRTLYIAVMGYSFRGGNRRFLLTWLPPAPLLQALLGDSGGQNWSPGPPDKYGRLDRELQLANSHFIEEQQAQQQVQKVGRLPAGGLWGTPGRLDQSLPCSCSRLHVE